MSAMSEEIARQARMDAAEYQRQQGFESFERRLRREKKVERARQESMYRSLQDASGRFLDDDTVAHLLRQRPFPTIEHLQHEIALNGGDFPARWKAAVAAGIKRIKCKRGPSAQYRI